MLSKILKYLQKKISVIEYNFYTVDTSNFRSKPESINGFSEYYSKINLERFTTHLPEKLHSVWKSLIARKGYFPFIILDHEGRMANYIFYTYNNKVRLDEFKKDLKLMKDEVYLSSGRTMDDYKGYNLSAYGKKYLFYLLADQGINRAFLFARSNNLGSNKINHKIGIPLTHRIKVIKIFSTQILSIKPASKDCINLKERTKSQITLPRIKKKLFLLKQFLLYKVDLRDFFASSELRSFSSDLTYCICKSEDMFQQIGNVPCYAQELWLNISEFHDGYSLFYVKNEAGIIVYYFFFRIGGSILLKEVGKKLELSNQEVYLSAERTFPEYRDKGISQTAKWELFNYLYNNGMLYAYFIVERNKVIPNHIYKKMGLIPHIKVISIRFFMALFHISIKLNSSKC